MCILNEKGGEREEKLQRDPYFTQNGQSSVTPLMPFSVCGEGIEMRALVLFLLSSSLGRGKSEACLIPFFITSSILWEDMEKIWNLICSSCWLSLSILMTGKKIFKILYIFYSKEKLD